MNKISKLLLLMICVSSITVAQNKQESNTSKNQSVLRAGNKKELIVITENINSFQKLTPLQEQELKKFNDAYDTKKRELMAKYGDNEIEKHLNELPIPPSFINQKNN